MYSFETFESFVNLCLLMPLTESVFSSGTWCLLVDNVLFGLLTKALSCKICWSTFTKLKFRKKIRNSTTIFVGLCNKHAWSHMVSKMFPVSWGHDVTWQSFGSVCCLTGRLGTNNFEWCLPVYAILSCRFISLFDCDFLDVQKLCVIWNFH